MPAQSSVAPPPAWDSESLDGSTYPESGDPPLVPIRSIQFGLFGEQSLSQRSVVQFSQFNPVKKPGPNVGAINDPRLGAYVPEYVCSTCGQTANECPGHFGSIPLRAPVASGVFVALLPKILNCLCVRCAQLLVPVNEARRDRLDKLEYKKRLNELSATALRYRECRECGAVQPRYWHRQAQVVVRPVFDPADFGGDAAAVPVVSQFHLYRLVDSAPDEVSELMGFNPATSHIRSCVQRQHLVPPNIMRPGGHDNRENDVSGRLRAVAKANERLEAHLAASAGDPEDLLDLAMVAGASAREPPREVPGRFPAGGKSTFTKNKVPVVPLHLEALFDLQRNVAGFQDRRLMPKLDNDYGLEMKDIKTRFISSRNAKFGRVRYNILGKRSDFTARAVTSPCNRLQPDEVGVPFHICRVITQAVVVTAANFNRLYRLVLNGPERYPGANYVERAGRLYTLPYFCKDGLRPGDVVHRHLERGDLVLINRQPSLHKYSLMAYRAVPRPTSTLQISLTVTEALNADFDGDELNLFGLSNYESIAEARELMAVSRNIFKDGRPIVAFVQHACLGAYLLTQEDCTLSAAEVQRLLCTSNDGAFIAAAWARLAPAGGALAPAVPVPGREFLRSLLPTYEPAHHGVVRKKLLNSLMFRACTWGFWDCDGYVRNLGFMCKIFDEFLITRGSTLSLRDCLAAPLPDRLRERAACAEALAREAELELRRVLAVRGPQGASSKRVRQLDRQVCQYLDDVRDIVGKHCIEDMRGRFSNLFQITDSGAKGNMSHIIQNSGLIGQQLDNNSARTFYEWVHESDPLQAKGFVTSAFVDGMGPVEFFMHLVGARGGLVETSVSTAITGYMHRKCSKSLEDLRVMFDNSVRTAQGDVVMCSFGFNTCALASWPVRLHLASEAELAAGRDLSSEGAAEELDHLLRLRAELLAVRGVPRDTVLLPVDFRALASVAARAALGGGGGGGGGKPASDLQVVRSVRATWERLCREDFVPDSLVKRAVWFWELSLAELRRAGVQTEKQLLAVLDFVARRLAEGVIEPGTAIGILSSQSLSAPLTQMQLDRFHISGQSCALVGGVDRIKQIFNCSKNIPTPSMDVYLEPGCPLSPIRLVELVFADCFLGWFVSEDPPGRVRAFEALAEPGPEPPGPSYLQLELNRGVLADRHISPRVVAARLTALLISPQTSRAVGFCAPPAAAAAAGKNAELIPRLVTYASVREVHWWVVVDTGRLFGREAGTQRRRTELEHALATFVVTCKTVVDGVPGVRDFFETEQKVMTRVGSGREEKMVPVSRRVVQTLGSNIMAISQVPGVDVGLTSTNDIWELYHNFGIEVVRRSIEDQLVSIMSNNSASVSRQHVRLVSHSICRTGVPCALSYSGMNNANASKLKCATFERIVDSFLASGVKGELDQLQGVSESVMVGTPVSVGTGSTDFELLPDPRAQPAPPARPRADRQQVPTTSFYRSAPKPELRTFPFQFELPSGTDPNLPAGETRAPKRPRPNRVQKNKKKNKRARVEEAPAPMVQTGAIDLFDLTRTPSDIFVPTACSKNNTT